MPTYGQATPDAGGSPADPDYTHLDRGGGPAYASLTPTYTQATPDAGGRPADPDYARLDRGGGPAYASLTPVYGQAPSRQRISGPRPPAHISELADESC